VKTGPASQRGYYLYADFPGYARKLLFELRRGQVASDGLRTIAPQAIRDFEDATGAGKETTAA
jgi:hypothetical protein